LQVAAQGDERRGHQLDEALITGEVGERSGIVLHDLFGVVSLEVAVARRVEHDDDGHHLREAQVSGAVTVAAAADEPSPFPQWFKELAEVVYVTE
jgi:hypothetical protein